MAQRDSDLLALTIVGVRLSCPTGRSRSVRAGRRIRSLRQTLTTARPRFNLRLAEAFAYPRFSDLTKGREGVSAVASAERLKVRGDEAGVVDRRVVDRLEVLEQPARGDPGKTVPAA